MKHLEVEWAVKKFHEAKKNLNFEYDLETGNKI